MDELSESERGRSKKRRESTMVGLWARERDLGRSRELLKIGSGRKER